ncbi:serine-protein kinase ATM-like [Uloborus diversus]|uniref:serine-protein kinase ATM-like n=1 Tax=Uloborus diversus TaxID=327109 RepID=UPI002409C128|nr:serine-protein kinase ATM-like [Uloborus diversus]
MDDYEVAKRLRDCLVQLIEGKATEKKKQVDNLKTYLKQNQYVQHMNRSSAKGKVREHGALYITWGKCFGRIKDYIEQECERFKNRESSDSLSAIVRNNLAKEKRSCSDLFRCFVKAMKSSKQYDMAEPVMQHILAVMSRKFTQVSFGLDYSNILLKYILCDPFMCLKISSSTFDDAIWFYCKIIGNPPQGWERSLTTQILLQLLTIRFNFGIMDCTKILQFFTEIFDAVSTPCTLIKYACLLFEMLQTFYFEGIIEQCNLKSNFFTSHLMKTLNAVGEMPTKLKIDLSEKETILMLTDFICRITAVFKSKCQVYNTQSLEPFLEVAISCIPQNLFESILSFSLDNCNAEPSIELNPTFENFDMEEDISFDVDNRSGSNSRDGFDEMDDECINFETKLEDKDSLSFMDTKTLPEKLQLQLQCLDFLAEISQLLNDNSSLFRSFQEEMIVKLFSRLPENDQVLQRASDVHLVIKFLKCILLSNKLSDDYIDKILCTLRLLLNQFSQLQDVCQAVLDLFPLLYMHVHSNNSLQKKERMFHLLSILCKKQLEAEGSNNTSILIGKMLLQIIQFEPNVSWKKTDSDSILNQATSPCKKETVLYSLVMFLKSNFTSLRLYIADKINLYLSPETIDAVFLTVLSEVYDSFLQKSLSNGNFQVDENFNRLSVFLHYLCQVILRYPCLEKECIYIVCKLASSIKQDQAFFTKVLKQVSSLFGYESCKEYIEPHLPYIILRWLEEKNCLKEFPFQLLEIDSLKPFYREFFKVLVPLLLYCGENASLSELARELGMSEQEIMYECFPEIQAKILSSLSVNPTDSNAENCRRCLHSVIPSEVLNKANRNKCDEIVFLLLAMVKETNASHSPKCQAKKVLYLTPDDFSASVSLLMPLISDKSSSSHFLCNKADLIQNVFLSLSIILFKAKRAHEERRVLCMYRCFLDQLLPALSYDNKWSFFVIKELIYTILNFLDLQRNSADKDELLITYCSNLILSLCKQVMPHFKEVIGEYLPFMISSLVPFVNDSERGQQVLSLISFLVIDCAPHFVEYIPYLDPFPDLVMFSSLVDKLHSIKYMNAQLPLEKEIKLFLVSGKMMGKHTPEGIKHLYVQLKSAKNVQEMKQMVNKLKNKTLFSEDVKHSILHELVCHLSSLCSPDDIDKKVQKEASKCLGMIGPIAFSSVVLQPSIYARDSSLNSLEKSYLVILDILAEYLFDKSIDIKVTSSNVLKDLFSTVFGHKFFKTYENLLPKSMTMKYIFPFFTSQKGKEKEKLGRAEVEKLLDTYLWLPDKNGHSSWIIKLVCTILSSGVTQNCFYECLIPICAKQATFCEKILPYLIHTLLFLDDLHVLHAVSIGIESFFSHFSKWLQKAASNGSSSSPSFTKPEFEYSKATVQSMLSVLNHIWLNPKQEARNQRNVMKECFWKNLNYLEVAQAAQYCSAHFTAILYTELWCDVMREQVRSSDIVSDCSESSGSLDCSPLSFIGSRSRDKASLVYEILLDAYSRIGDSDAIYGCEVVSPDSQAILKHNYLTERKWDGLLRLNDKNNAHLDILMSLQQNGLNTILLDYAQSLLDGNKAPQQSVLEYQCEAAWRMRKWDLPVIENSEHGFQTYLYKSQQSLVSDNKAMFEQYLDLARKSQFNLPSHTSLESTRNIQPFLSNIKMLSVLEEFFAVKSNIEKLQALFENWELQDQIPYDDFEFFEPVSWLKCVLLNHLIDSDINKHIVIPQLRKLLERHAVRAREEFHLEVASNAVNTLRKMPCIEEEDLLRWQIEEAKILWTKKEFSIANKILKSSLHFIEKLAAENPNFVLCYGEALTLRGRWLAETCSENSSVIMQDYLEKAVLLLESVDCKRSNKASLLWDAYLAVARYADAQYQSIVNYKKSTAFLTKQELMHSSKEDAKKLKSKDNTEDQRKTHIIITKQTMIDQEEINTLEQDQKLFLNKAIMNYLRCLRGTDSHDLWIFRLISLWFQNFTDQSINSIVKDSIQKLHTYKFLPLIYQLAARMGTPAQGIFSQTLTSLIKSIAIDHPYHAVPVILALSNADQDPLESTKNNSDQPQQVDVPYIKERMIAAKKILSQLQKSKINGILKNYLDLCSAYIKLAYFPVDKKTRRGSIPEDQPLLKYKNLVNIPIITEDIKVDRSCQYESIVSVQSFHSEFRMCGGITLPKVIKCKGSDGVEREQLVKGGDDLRQDAVMQQVFFLVNQLLDQKMETKRRRLHIRTYKVVPISRKSGVIQWCDGTQVMSQYLVGTNGAHGRYYPQMASHVESRKKMETIASVSLLCKKREIFDSICANFPPVFRYFFLEHFPEPSAWFERRQSYTKSVAASSIVGYILGLGDRHVNNILIDKNTAEVVHIDFGIAFEKGRVLATPETVPFRLTRDIVDGMGVNGVEGTFKRCSEKTLEVMRNSQDVLLTILEVLLYDPLYEWTVPPSKSPTQRSNLPTSYGTQEVNKLAERALMRLQQKLQGLEEGVAMSIEGQVNLLIQQARDPNNLCRLYVGWQPYL